MGWGHDDDDEADEGWASGPDTMKGMMAMKGWIKEVTSELHERMDKLERMMQEVDRGTPTHKSHKH